MKKKSNNQKKEIWYPLTNKRDTLRIFKLQETEQDVLDFVNRACRAVYILQEKRYKK